MFFSLWIFAATVFVGTWALYFLEDSRGQGSAIEYRDHYERLIARLADVVDLANRLAAPAQVHRDGRILEIYLTHLKLLEALMEAVRGMPSYSTQANLLKAPLFLVDDTMVRFRLLAKDIDYGARGVRVPPLVGTAPQLGCYFCSRPFEVVSFHKVRVKVEGSSQDVAACKVCNAKLTAGKKAKVLFFTEGAETVHWSKAKAYQPSASFWNINDESAPLAEELSKDVSGGGNHLTLVYSNVTTLSSGRRLD
ncbi:MAG: hypothetical protein NTV34_14950 [Proteobacteria bacterium]|nr:hypothetical protein [Pseudomonadota bacterium]